MILLLKLFTTKCGSPQFRMTVFPVCAGLNNLLYLNFFFIPPGVFFLPAFFFFVRCINIAKQQISCMLCSVIDLSLVLLRFCCILMSSVAVVSVIF